jgi:hypothetical protein
MRSRGPGNEDDQRSERVARIEIHFDVFSQLYLSLFFMKLVEIL